MMSYRVFDPVEKLTTSLTRFSDRVIFQIAFVFVFALPHCIDWKTAEKLWCNSDYYFLNPQFYYTFVKYFRFKFIIISIEKSRYNKSILVIFYLNNICLFFNRNGCCKYVLGHSLWKGIMNNNIRLFQEKQKELEPLFFDYNRWISSGSSLKKIWPWYAVKNWIFFLAFCLIIWSKYWSALCLQHIRKLCFHSRSHDFENEEKA